MKKRIYLFTLSTLLLITPALTAGCQKRQVNTSKSEDISAAFPETVQLRVWGSAEDEELFRLLIDGFKKEYQGQADFVITFEPQGESGCTNALMADLEAGADVFTFADDQLNTLVAAGAVEPADHPESIRAANLEEAVTAASVDQTLYAYPLTADNGYFLYYK